MAAKVKATVTETVKLKVTGTYFDSILKRFVNPGEVLEVSQERAAVLVGKVAVKQ